MVTKSILDRSAQIGRSAVVRTLPVERAAWISALLGSSRVKKLLFLAGDVTAVMAAHSLAEILARHSMNIPVVFLNPSGYFLFYVPFFTALLYFLEGYKSHDLRRPEKELELLFKGISISFVALACANFILFKSLAFSRYLLVEWYLLALLFLLVARFSLRAMYGELWRRGLARQKAILLGSADDLADFERRLAIQRYRGYEMAGVLAESLECGVSPSARFAVPVLGPLENWEEIAEAERARLIVVHLADSAADRDPRALEIIRRCQEKRIDVEAYSELFGGSELLYERDEFSGFFRFYSSPRWSRSLQQAVKNLLDILVGLVGSAVTLALTPIVWLLLQWEDGGAIFHRRVYVGMDGRVRYFLKFRTMVEDAEQILENDTALNLRFKHSLKLKDDPRVLRVGRFLRKYSLDEFPQFFSVLRGRLTFVGPRAIAPEACERYGALLPKLLSMKPGLTGYWQVMGRQTTTYEEKIQMEMFYIDHWSIWLDLVIIAKTFWEVLRAEGAY
jgi:exopolysaccharide biosynthesis polyprenyl glycosylphosphotransferase